MARDETPPRPLPPPPRPQQHPRRLAVASASTAASQVRFTAREAKRELEDDDEDEELKPSHLPPPAPHQHPLAALASARAPSRAAGQRLNPAFLNPARVAAFAGDKENLDTSLTVYATERPLGTQVIERELRIQQTLSAPVESPVLLNSEQMAAAATDAAQFRTALPYSIREIPQPDTALARARTRKVDKQLDAAWVRARRDPENRPSRARDRPEELPLYETRHRLTLADLQDQVGRDFSSRKSAPVTWSYRPAPPSRGFIGLPGSCFDTPD